MKSAKRAETAALPLATGKRRLPAKSHKRIIARIFRSGSRCRLFPLGGDDASLILINKPDCPVNTPPPQKLSGHVGTTSAGVTTTSSLDSCCGNEDVVSGAKPPRCPSPCVFLTRPSPSLSGVAPHRGQGRRHWRAALIELSVRPGERAKSPSKTSISPD